jgi:hypothetical protein
VEKLDIVLLNHGSIRYTKCSRFGVLAPFCSKVPAIMSTYTHKIATSVRRLSYHACMQFCRKIEQLYGKDEVTANHIKSCIEDYGPLHGFWVYALERYNGILECFKQQYIKPQLIERFLNDSMVQSTILPTEFEENFKTLFFFDATRSFCGWITGRHNVAI